MFGAILCCLVGAIILWYFYKLKLRKYINKDERRRFFAEFLKDFPSVHNPKTDVEKRTLFQELTSLQSKVPDARKKGCIKILEIGVGSGANFEYYPSSCHLVALDPNPWFKNYFMENLKSFPEIHLEKYCVSSAEDMKDIEDESIDAVVSTLVACSLKDVQKVYKEIQRVLVPGGKFLYMEHVLDKHGTSLYYKQQILSLSYIWPFLVDGCHLNRNLDAEVEKSGFSQVSQNRFYIDTSGPLFFPDVLKSHLMGVATK